jgi:hypothetical protein
MIACPKCGQSYSNTAYTVDEEGVVTPVPHKCPAATPGRALVDLTTPEWVHTRPQKREDRFTCPHCQASMPRSNLSLHLDLSLHLEECHAYLRLSSKGVTPPAHKLSRKGAKRPPAPAPTGEWVTCADCGTKVISRNLAKHQAKCPRASVPCPYCGTPIMRFMLVGHKTHCDRSPHNRPALPQPRKKRQPNQAPSWTRPTRRPTRNTGSRTAGQSTPNSLANDHLGTRDDLDASKGWGHRFRDHGSFGSYPIHDSFDDESKP